ncbi:MAG: alpha-1,2-fucosyltransferase [Lachnospiraceae bacterium]|nr:alpha-1,2-fucosyltransferase [Lachnospiraceae bacterium]
MVIIQLAGGLGNQLFQYALYLQLKRLGKTVKIDDAAGFVQDTQRDPALKYFGIEYERATAEELRQMLDSSMLPWARVRRKLFGRKKKSYFEADKRFHPEIMEWDDIYLEGYWQTEKYFAGVSQEVRAAYDMDRLLQFADAAMQDNGERCTAAKWLTQINDTESVSVHIRRGDYLLPENQELFGGICTEAYYLRAMELMKREHPECIFYIFTNDKQWIRKQITEAGTADQAKTSDEAKAAETTERAVTTDLIKIVEIPETAGTAEQRDYTEFALMSKCRHHILANSSYSWWASYLCRNPHKTVLAPDRWLNGWDCTDIYRQDMQRVPTSDLP